MGDEPKEQSSKHALQEGTHGFTKLTMDISLMTKLAKKFQTTIYKLKKVNTGIPNQMNQGILSTMNIICSNDMLIIFGYMETMTTMKIMIIHLMRLKITISKIPWIIIKAKQQLAQASHLDSQSGEHSHSSEGSCSPTHDPYSSTLFQDAQDPFDTHP